MSVVRLTIDFENPARSWWENGGQELWDGLSEGFDESGVVLDESLARSWLEEAGRIAGWNDGPDYAPHPIRLEEVDEDEIV